MCLPCAAELFASILHLFEAGIANTASNDEKYQFMKIDISNIQVLH